MWQDLCRAIGREELIEDPRFEHQSDRLENGDALKQEITAWTMQHDKYEAMRVLAEAGVPASAVLDTKDLYDNPHLAERGFIHTVEHEVHGPIKLLGWPARMSESEVAMKAAPLLGRHSSEVVAEDLSLTPAEINGLIESGVISQADPV
jgi:formyl-CoA transferase